MKLLLTVLQFTAAVLLCSCGNNELGMKITITERAAPYPLPKVATEAMAGKLRIAVVGTPTAENQALTEAIAAVFTAEKPPAGELTFTKLSIRNRRMEHPARASAEIDATCMWIEAGGAPTGFDVTVRTHSIPLDNESQLQYLRDQALAGMARQLARDL